MSQFLSPWTNHRKDKYGGSLDNRLRFEAEGASALVPSCGFTPRTPLYIMRGNVPNAEMARNQSNPFIMSLGLLTFGRFMVETYPFEPMYLLEGARKIKDAVNIPVIYIGGILSLANMESAMNDGSEFVEIGQATIRDPGFVKRLQAGEIAESDCDHCNQCIAAMDAGGVHCVCDEKGFLRNSYLK